MKKKTISLLIVYLMIVSMLTGCGDVSQNNSATTSETTDFKSGKAITEEIIEIIRGDNDPDFDSMTIKQWATYEFNMDYATLFSDITSYDHEFLRHMLDVHWSTYLSCTSPTSDQTEEELRKALTTWQNTRMTAVPVSNPESNRIYLWPRGKVPSVTYYTENKDYSYADNPGFEPFMLESLVKRGTEIKGAVIISAGGGFNYRSNVEEGLEVALAFNELGYQCFIVNYRVNPYTKDESALDVARAVRIVRSNATKYGIEKNRIACAGFSAGGIATSMAADIYNDSINASVLVKDYVPDDFDDISTDMNAYLAVYSVTPDTITNNFFPPTFFAFGSDDKIWDWVMRCFRNCLDLNIRVEIHTFAGVPHGFGAGVGADGIVYSNAKTWPSLADLFMQDVYKKEDIIKESGKAE